MISFQLLLTTLFWAGLALLLFEIVWYKLETKLSLLKNMPAELLEETGLGYFISKYIMQLAFLVAVPSVAYSWFYVLIPFYGVRAGVGMAVFIFVGCLPAKEMIMSGNIQSFLGPLLNNPIKSGFFILAGLGLMSGAIYVKPKKFTFFHAIALILIALSSYIAGSLALAPGNLDMISKTIFVLKSSLENLFAKNNIIPYAVFCQAYY